jgi:adenylate cyclase
MQRSMTDRNIGIAPDRRITLRIGIGEVTAIGDDLVSRAVAALPVETIATLLKPGTEIYNDSGSIAVRLAALADPGGICISGMVRDAVRDQLPYTFEDSGKQNLESRAARVLCYTMRANALGRARTSRANQQSSPNRQNRCRLR